MTSLNLECFNRANSFDRIEKMTVFRLDIADGLTVISARYSYIWACCLLRLKVSLKSGLGEVVTG